MSESESVFECKYAWNGDDVVNVSVNGNVSEAQMKIVWISIQFSVWLKLKRKIWMWKRFRGSHFAMAKFNRLYPIIHTKIDFWFTFYTLCDYAWRQSFHFFSMRREGLTKLERSEDAAAEKKIRWTRNTTARSCVDCSRRRVENARTLNVWHWITNAKLVLKINWLWYCQKGVVIIV